ncbi:MAG: hypothetical protein HWQ38_26095 [Nostoc sp. NMS7]|uniref:hypothetical protein n=1 Tax=Nostoc sp. NMS7 TaxID=2815391 RepID=UPI0025D1CA09|nr:hypothetical protein [Nostoc sp. NMS7]MBN3949748.1 hypothetical protein [Nostoc sp. NMS7]
MVAHIIERTEYKIYIQSHRYLPLKEYRHNYPNERINVVAEVQSAWSQVKALAVPVDLTVDDATTDAALNRFQTQAVDGYDLLLLEAISRAGAGKIKIIATDRELRTAIKSQNTLLKARFPRTVLTALATAISHMTWIMLLFQIFRYLRVTTTSSKQLIYKKNSWLADSSY